MQQRKRCVCRAELTAEPSTVEQAVAEHQRAPEHRRAWRRVEERLYLGGELLPPVRVARVA